MARTLRSVGDQERPPRRHFATVLDAAKTGTRRELLVAMRDRIAEAVSRVDCPSKDLSPLTRRLQELDRDIACLDVVEQLEGPPLEGPPLADAFDPTKI